MSKFKNTEDIRFVCTRRAKVLRNRGEDVSWSSILGSYIWTPKRPLTKITAAVQTNIERERRVQY